MFSGVVKVVASENKLPLGTLPACVCAFVRLCAPEAQCQGFAVAVPLRSYFNWIGSNARNSALHWHIPLLPL